VKRRRPLSDGGCLLMTGKAWERPPGSVPGNPKAQTRASASTVKENLTGTLDMPEPITSMLLDHIPPCPALSSSAMVNSVSCCTQKLIGTPSRCWNTLTARLPVKILLGCLVLDILLAGFAVQVSKHGMWDIEIRWPARLDDVIDVQGDNTKARSRRMVSGRLKVLLDLEA
jgi:hypothetical protein